MALLEIGRPLEAADAFSAAVRLSPERPALRFHVALALFRGIEPEMSLRILNDLDKDASLPLHREIKALRDHITTGR